MKKRESIKLTRKTYLFTLLYLLLTLIGVSLFVYFYFLQVPSFVSVKRLVSSIAAAAFLMSGILAPIVRKKKLISSLEKKKSFTWFLQTILVVCYFLFFIPLPINHLFSRTINLTASFHTDVNSAEAIEILWINNGLRDISFSDLQYINGQIIEDVGLILSYDEESSTEINWKGTAWKSYSMLIKSEESFSANITVNGNSYAIEYDPSDMREYQISIPMSSPLQNFVAQSLVPLSAFFTIALLLFIFPLYFREVHIRGDFLRKVNIKTGVWIVALANILFPILAYLAIIGMNNHLYLDDYCYLLGVRKNGYFGAILEALRYITGRYMSHIFDYFIYIWEDALIPYGMLFSIIFGIAGLMFLIQAILDVKTSFRKWMVSFSLSAIIVLGTFLLCPYIYESVFWSLHALIVFGGITIFNFSFGLLLRIYSQTLTVRRPFLMVLVFFLLGFLSCGFHENTSMMILLLSGLVWLALVLNKKKSHALIHSRMMSFLYILGGLTGFFTIIFMPGEQYRLSGVASSLNVGQIMVNVVNLTLVKVQVLFDSIHYLGLLVIIILAGLAFLFGNCILLKKPFDTIHLNKGILWFLFLLPFVMFIISLTPSTFISNYYPNRTLVIPLYFFVFVLFSTAFFSGAQYPQKFELVLVKLITLLLMVFLVLLSFIHFLPLGNQFEQFSEEWERRDTQIRQSVEAGLTEVNVDPYQYSFGVDISPTNNDFLTQCYNEYYGIYVIPPQ